MENHKRSIFVIGDSISIHYGPYLKNVIEDKFNYDRKRGINEALVNLDKPIGANAGDSSMVLKYLTDASLRGVQYDILLVNSGMHDIRVDRKSLSKQVNEVEYEDNLNKIIDISEKMANKVIWITTTPLIDDVHNSRKEGFLRYNKDLQVYNEIAKNVMSKRDIEYIDLYTFTKTLGDNVYCDHVHFVEDVRKLQATFIAEYLNYIVT